MKKYCICINNGQFVEQVDFKSVDLAVSHILSAMDLGYTVVFEPLKESEN